MTTELFGPMRTFAAWTFVATSLLLPQQLSARPEGMPMSVAATEDRIQIAREFISISMPPEMREEMFFATMDQMVMQMRVAQGDTIDDPQVKAIVDRHLAEMTSEMKDITRHHIPKLMEALAQSYAAIFTHDELADILAFARTTSLPSPEPRAAGNSWSLEGRPSPNPITRLRTKPS